MDSGRVAGATGMSGHTPLPPIGHTESGKGAYSCRHGSFTPLALAGKSAQASIGSLAGRTSPAPTGGDVNLKTVLGWVALAFVIWWVIEQPTAAAHLVHNIGAFLSTMATGLSNFIASV